MSDNKYKHFIFLDGVRFVCAMWVVFSHLGAPPIFKSIAENFHGKSADILILAQRGFGVTFNGTAAVVVFFIISGFCIHYPYASGKIFKLKSFYLARMARIGIPLLLVTLLASALPNGLRRLGNVAWSLYAEMIYYVIYPLLSAAYVKYSINRVLFISACASLGLSMWNDDVGGYLWCYGAGLTWLLCLPIWILGCKLAENVFVMSWPEIILRKHSLILLRALMIVFSSFTGVCAFMQWVGFKHSMFFYAIIAYAWLLCEFAQSCRAKSDSVVNRFGMACYSIYLIHTQVPIVLNLFFPDGMYYGWTVTMAAVSIFSALTYFVIEKPSHILSKKLSKYA